MSTHEEGIIREAAAAAQMARLHGCAIDVKIKRFGHMTSVTINPEGDWELTVDDTERTQIMGGEVPQPVKPATAK